MRQLLDHPGSEQPPQPPASHQKPQPPQADERDHARNRDHDPVEGLHALPSTAKGDEPGTHAVRIGVLGAGLGGADTAHVLDHWRRLFPGVAAVYVALDSYTHDTAVLSGYVDLAVLCITGTEEPELLSHTAYSTQRALVVPAGDPFADADLVHPEEVADRELLYSVVPGRLGGLWSDVPVDQGRKDVTITDPAYVALTVLTTGRPATHSMAAASLGTVQGTVFVPLSGARVDMGVQIRADEQRPAVRALFDLVRLHTVTGPDPQPGTL